MFYILEKRLGQPVSTNVKVYGPFKTCGYHNNAGFKRYSVVDLKYLFYDSLGG